MSFTTKFTSATGAALLLATTTMGGGNALAQEREMPPPTQKQINSTCGKLTAAINDIPGFTIMFAGHPSLRNYKPDNLRHAAEQMCPPIKKIWKQKDGPAHHWKRKDTGAFLRTEKDIAPALVSAVQQFHDIMHNDPAINALVHGTNEAHQDFHFVMAEAQRLIAQYPDIFGQKPQQPPQPGESAPAPEQQAPAAPDQQMPAVPENKIPEAQPAPPSIPAPEAQKSENEKACEFFTQGMDKHPGFTILLKGHELFPDYDPKPMADAVRKACKIDDALWNKAPAHNWTGPRTGKFDTVDKLVPAVGDAAMKIHYLARTTEAFKTIVRDDKAAWTALEKFMGELKAHVLGKRQPASPSPSSPAPQ